MDLNLIEIEKLKETARHYREQITASNPIPVPFFGDLFPDEIHSNSLTSFVNRLNIFQSSINESEQVFVNILLLEAYLGRINDVSHDTANRDASCRICEWAAEVILPPKEFAEQAPYRTERIEVPTPDKIAKFHFMSMKGLSIISHLQKSFPFSDDESVIKLFTCIASFSDDSDPWTSHETVEQASALADECTDSSHVPLLLAGLLQQSVKPLFAKSRHRAITQQGRRAIDPISNLANTHANLDLENKLWKYQHPYIVTVFQWILKHLNISTMETNWPLIIPPLLALIDDSSILHKVKGCNLLSVFLAICPSTLVQRTGLGEVFENAIMPFLLYLPSLTEEEDSLQLLKAAYPALIFLALVRFPGAEWRVSRSNALNRVIRYGIYKGYAHAGSHCKIAEVLVLQIIALFSEMGVESVRHLKHIVPLLSANLAAPFAIAYPPLISASVQALQIIIIDDWPRIPLYGGELLKGLTTCWLRIQEQETGLQEFQSVKNSVEQAIRSLTAVLKRSINVEREYQTLFESDIRLRVLLRIC